MIHKELQPNLLCVFVVSGICITLSIIYMKYYICSEISSYTSCGFRTKRRGTEENMEKWVGRLKVKESQLTKQWMLEFQTTI